ncbi:MAG: Ig-like domain-containing protein [Thermodesulfobacteriota bacterium]
MAEEKAGLDIDDWLDDLEEDKSAASNGVGGDLDQNDIDALLGGGGPAPSAGPPPAPASDSGELDQSDIDSLFAAASPAPAPAPASDGGDLDQNDIDALLGGGSAAPPPAAPASDSGELDQSDIDSLFASAAPAASPEPAASSPGELDQSDIDSLFTASTPAPEPPPATTSRLTASSNDDLDELFAGMDDADSGMKTVGFEEVARSTEPAQNAMDDHSFGLPDDSSGFDDHDEFDFGDLPDIPDETEGVATVGMTAAGKSVEEDIFATTASKAVEPDLAKILAEDTTHARQEIPIDTAPRHARTGGGGLMNRKRLAVAVLGLAALAGGGYFYLYGKKGAEPPAAVVQEQPPAPAVNAPPEVADIKLQLPKPGEAANLTLTATDKEGDPLQYEILSPPRYGVLSGDMPALTYIPNPDFPGEDSFEFRASDGKHASPPAKVLIAGQPAPPPAPAKAEALAKKPDTEVKAKEATEEAPPLPQLAAVNAKLRTKSTAALVIDWKKLWPQDSAEPMPEGLKVEVVGHDLRGELTRLDATRYRYQPDRYFGGSGVVRYRFRAEGFAPSKTGKVTVAVAKNDKPPKVAVAPMAKEYQVGGKVVLDASPSKDDSPGGLRYSWEQVSGVPVRLAPLNASGSMVSFVAPSSFQPQDRVTVRVTAVDPGNQQSSKEIEITTVSRRKGQSALWGF